MRHKNIILSISFHMISLVLGITFILAIANTKNTRVSYDYIDEEVLNVSSFITDSESNNNEKLSEFLKTLYEERNNSIKTGNVEKLYGYYDITTNFGANSLKNEFKRISYLREWSLAKKSNFKEITSKIVLKSLKEKKGILTISLQENFSFTFSYNKEPENEHEFEHSMVHTLQVKELEKGNFIILNDYYEDFLNGVLDNYNFDLTEKNLVPNQKVKKNLNFLIE